MARNLSYNLKRVVAGLCAVLIVAGAVPGQPIADLFKSSGIVANAEALEPTVDATSISPNTLLKAGTVINSDSAFELVYCSRVGANDENTNVEGTEETIYSTTEAAPKYTIPDNQDYWVFSVDTSGDTRKVKVVNANYTFTEKNGKYTSNNYAISTDWRQWTAAYKEISFSAADNPYGKTIDWTDDSDTTDYFYLYVDGELKATGSYWNESGSVNVESGEHTILAVYYKDQKYNAGTDRASFTVSDLRLNMTFDASTKGFITSMKSGTDDVTDNGFTVGKQVTIVSKAKLDFYNSNGRSLKYVVNDFVINDVPALGTYTYTFTMPDDEIEVSHEHSISVEPGSKETSDTFSVGCDSEYGAMQALYKLTTADCTYDGTAHEAVLTTNANPYTEDEFKVESASEITYKDSAGTVLESAPVNAGTYTAEMTITYKINSGKTQSRTIKSTYTIARKSVGDNDVYIVLTPSSKSYDGAAPSFEVIAFRSLPSSDPSNPNNIPLIAGTDFVYSVTSNGSNAGKYTVTVEGKGNYTGTKDLTYEITAADVSKQITFTANNKTYDATPYGSGNYSVKGTGLGNTFLNESTTAVSVSYYSCDETGFAASTKGLAGGKILKPGVTYDFESEENNGYTSGIMFADSGLIFKTICFNNNGTFTGTTWDGSSVMDHYDTNKFYMVKQDAAPDNTICIIEPVDKSQALMNTPLTSEPTDAGYYVAKATIRGSDNYQTVTKYDDFEIEKKTATIKMGYNEIDYGQYSVTALVDFYELSGVCDVDIAAVGAQMPVKLVDSHNSEMENSYIAYPDAGTYTYALTDHALGLKNYNFVISNDTLTVNSFGINNVDFGDFKDQFIYNDKPQVPTFTLFYPNKNVQLAVGNDYTITYHKDSADGEVVASPTNAGSYYAVFKGEGNYTGTTSKYFEILPRSLIGADSMYHLLMDLMTAMLRTSATI